MTSKLQNNGWLIRNLSKVAIFISLSFIQLDSVYAQRERDHLAAPLPRVEIPGTQLLKITSAIVGQEYDLFIHLPRHYEDTAKSFPVLYLLDAQWDFPLITAIYGEQYYDGFLPGIIIAGVTWGGRNPNHDSLRARDLTPTAIASVPQSGNAAKFLAFMKQELLPFIESRYRTTKNDRTLMGSSLGGLFTLYAMLQETEMFKRYVLTSPAMGWDNGAIYHYEEQYAGHHRSLPVRLFMAVGELEETSGFKKFADHLRARNYEGLKLQTRILEGIGHSGSKAEGFTRGLQAVFARPALAVDSATLERYVGVYQLGPDLRVELSHKNGRLMASTSDGTSLDLYAETERDFYVNGQYLFVRFKDDETGKLAGFQMERFSGEAFVRKVK